MVLATAVLGLGFFASFISYTRRTFPSVSMDPPTDCQQGQDSELVIAGCTAWLAQGINDPLAISDAYLFRGRAHAGLDQLVQAREDYDLAIQTLPNYPFAFEERGQLNEYEHRYEAAFSDTAAALTHINTLLQAYPAHQPYLDTRKRLEPKLVYRQRRLDLEIHWRNYLETIQQQGDHSNWSGPPADLYWSHHEK
jgi:tetratricopeptide (TPR) repeat protein